MRIRYSFKCNGWDLKINIHIPFPICSSSKEILCTYEIVGISSEKKGIINLEKGIIEIDPTAIGNYENPNKTKIIEKIKIPKYQLLQIKN